jgi:OmcA/MtrC family decaheme c-type cytochrome
MFVDNYFKGTDAIVETEKCNVCHDQLGVTFHSGSGRGGDIVACRNCHNPTFTGSNLEMASRATENYVHTIHSFQDFNTSDTFETFDPVFAKRYDQHIKHVFPNFTINNCEACHVTGTTATYNVPDQSKSMPGVLSMSDDVMTWYQLDADDLAVEDPSGRNIGTVPEYVTGPASRACGACHRARLINQDEAGALASFNAHTEAGGTLSENDAGSDTVLYGVIEKIMSMFQ